MDYIAYKEINFDNIVLGSLIMPDCRGILRFSPEQQAFEIDFYLETSYRFKIYLSINDIKKIFKSTTDDQMVLDFKLKPAAIKSVGEYIRIKDFVFQISKNVDECKFQVYLNHIDPDDISFIENFFSSIDIFDENVERIAKEPEPETSTKVPKPLIFKSRKKKHVNNFEDESDDYFPQKRQRKQSFSKPDETYVPEEIPKRSLRVRNRDEVNLCEDMSEEAQLEEALKRSMKGIDPSLIDTMNLTEENYKSEKELEHQQLYNNIDKTIELFTYNTCNGDIIVRMEDYLCLSRNEYLSDVIIDFYLHFIYNVKMTQEQREKTLIIGTHFYTLYATSSEYSGWNDGLNAGLNAKEKRYRRIDGILKDDVNIFEKDYIIMPLMDHNHWFLAIVCFPKLNGSYTIDGSVKIEPDDAKRIPKKVQPPIKSSCVLIFDSIKGNGSRRTVAINHIKNFLEHEWKNKYEGDFPFDIKNVSGHSPRVPLQLNNVDCGCFILEFVERFFVTAPIQDLRFPIDLSDWFSPEDVRYSKRRELAIVIRGMIDFSEREIELPNIRFYGDRPRKVSTNNHNIVQTIDLVDNMDNNNCNPVENMENGNNNDENFNNNNNNNCLDNNALMIHENYEIVQENEQGNEDIDERVHYAETILTIGENINLNDYEQDAFFDEITDDIISEQKTDPNILNVSDDVMEVDDNNDNNETEKGTNEIFDELLKANGCDAEKNDAIKISDAKEDAINGNDAKEDAIIGNDAKEDAINGNDAENDEPSEIKENNVTDQNVIEGHENENNQNFENEQSIIEKINQHSQSITPHTDNIIVLID